MLSSKNFATMATWLNDFSSLLFQFRFTDSWPDSRTYTQSYPHRGTRWGGGGVLMEPPWVFDMLQPFETTLPSVESLWSSLQDEIFFMAGGAAVGLWRHQTWPPSWILSRIKNNVKTVRINNFLRLTCKITQITLHHHHHHYSSIFFLPSSPPPPSLPPPSTRFCCFFPPPPPLPPPPTPHFSIRNLSLWREPCFLTRLPSKARLTHPGAQLRHYFRLLR